MQRLTLAEALTVIGWAFGTIACGLVAGYLLGLLMGWWA